jgi:hypothetical protein
VAGAVERDHPAALDECPHDPAFSFLERAKYSISLSGTAEIEVGDGTVARIGPGDVVLAEDLTGQGHITRVVGEQPRFYAIVPLAESD